METVERCLTDAKMSKEIVDDVVMVGATLSGQGNDKVQELVLVEVTPLSLGVEYIGEAMEVAVPRNTAIPTKVTIWMTTTKDYQFDMEIKAFEGERARSIANICLDSFLLSGIQQAPRGVPDISICFELQANGILNVSAKDMITFAEESIRITRGNSLSSRDEIEKMIEDAKKYEGEDEQYRKKYAARCDFEEYFCQRRDNINNNTVSFAEIEKAKDAILKAFQWLDNLDASKKLAEVDEYEEKVKELTDAKKSTKWIG
ncbi:OLC1v1008797C1 [Oldenlandia corymbosa var. corymbosa]|uniref:OLC1v1008797C1 n=1 Tax=Oldenlandia corymbosa var. corymbosa TaxID=529605 RepID=A0AAV1DPX0_OLDCO|nr:OLC1v1008797C1 [Oldenlandia corymbosa var. corymbosa]